MKAQIIIKIIKPLSIILFLYIAFFSIQNFWQGYHDLDISFNFLNTGNFSDISTSWEVINLNNVYMMGLNQTRTSFIWLTLDCILAVVIGYIFKGDKR